MNFNELKTKLAQSAKTVAAKLPAPKTVGVAAGVVGVGALVLAAQAVATAALNDLGHDIIDLF